MNLSLYTGGVKPYLEYGWVCAPNTAGQSITANTITTLTIDTEIADTGNFGSIASNQITLAAGTYYFEAISTIFIYLGYGGGTLIGNLLLRNVSDSAFSRRSQAIFSPPNAGDKYCSVDLSLTSCVTIGSSKIFELQAYSSGASTVGNVSVLATPGADQRTTIKLWKLA